MEQLKWRIYSNQLETQSYITVEAAVVRVGSNSQIEFFVDECSISPVCIAPREAIVVRPEVVK